MEGYKREGNLQCRKTINSDKNDNCMLGLDFNSLFNSLQDAIFVTDTSGNVLFCNESFKKQTGLPNTLEKVSITNFFAASGHHEVVTAIEKAGNGEAAVNKVPFVNVNGDEVPVENRFVSGNWNSQKIVIGTCRDISETIRFEKQIKISSERLEMVLLASDAGWYDWKIETDSLILNDKWCSMRGFRPEEIPPHVESWKKLLHPDDLPLALENLERHFRNEVPFYQAEYRAKTKDGGYIWILDTGKVVEVNAAGAPSRVVGINININAQKDNELKLQVNLRQQELLSEIALELNSLEGFDVRINNVLQKVGTHTEVSRVYIFEDSNDGLFTNNTFEWCNDEISPQINDLQNIPYELIPSWKKTLSKDGRLHSEDISKLPEDLRAILEPQGIKSIIIYPLLVKGAFFGFIGFDECIRNKHWSKSELELLRTFSGIIANAYERRRSEKSLQESELRNRAILESIPDILFQFNKEGIILSYRSSSVEELVIHPDVFLNKKVTDIFPSEFSNKVMAAIGNCLESGSFRFDYDLPVNGILCDYEARMSKMNDNEVIALVRNVSERKNYERQLTEERDKANQANRAKSEFLANMSHEIRTPMNAILGFSEALYHKIESPQHQKMLKSILGSGNLLLSLLNDILDLSKIEAGMMEISNQPVDLGNTIKEIKLLFLSKAEKKNIEINLYHSPDFPELLMLDEIRVKQVIFNLVGNAIKFTHTGYVNIKAAFYGSGNEGKLRIDVEDTGIGIPESQQQIIFESFRQQSGQSNRLYEGAGLGLAISKRLVEKMNGEISVRSTEGKGSEFTVIIPCSMANTFNHNSIQEMLPDEEVVFETSEILVVDDVASNIEAVESLLDGTGIKVLSAENGEIALEILKNSKPELVLLDLRMPVMNGYETARRIREDDTFSRVPIIAYTASVIGSDHGIKTEYFNSFLYKPVSRGALFQEMMRYLRYNSVSVENCNNTVSEITLDKLPDKLVHQLPEIYNRIIEKHYSRWEAIKDQLVLFRIEEFAVELKEMAVSFDFEYLSMYADKLMNEIDIVDLEAIKETLSEFSDIVTKISKLINK